jgi:hypothetical protein
MAYKSIITLIVKVIIGTSIPAVMAIYGFASAFLAFRDPERWFNAGWTPKRGLGADTTDGDIKAMGVLSFVIASVAGYVTVRILWGAGVILSQQLSKTP